MDQKTRPSRVFLWAKTFQASDRPHEDCPNGPKALW